MKLTAATLQKLKLSPGTADKIFFDDGLSGFGLRVRDGGKRTWIAQYRVGTKQRRVTLGTVENLDAQAARQRAKDVLSKVHLGGDPQTEKAERRAQESVTRRRDGRTVPRSARRSASSRAASRKWSAT